MEKKMNRVLVSIIIRTCQRPYILKRALESIVIQSYPEIQVVIVEDGNNESEKFIKERIPQIKPVESDATYLMWLDCTDIASDSDGLKDFICE